MHGLVLAGGEGSRLAAGGVAVPKPLVPVAGRPLILRLLETLAALGCDTLTCAVRADFAAVFRVLDERRFGRPLRVIPCRTPSSLHTLVAGLAVVPAGPVFATMVDTVMRRDDWELAYRRVAADLAAGAAAVLVVTPYVDDEAPVYVECRRDGTVAAVRPTPPVRPLVTGGVYGLSVAARAAAGDAQASGVGRVRGFLERLVATGHPVRTVEIARVIDVDRPADLALADAWLAAERGCREDPRG
jgi:bifunctional UDP-N-acetylglucosamine pyrophosphorylase/glucosamine-1-phosphate N-acetyltransferase